MSLESYEIGDLIAKYIQQKLSNKEHQQLLDWRNENSANQTLFERLVKAEEVKKGIDFFDAVDVDAAWEQANRKRRLRKITRIAPYLGSAAAVAVLVASFFIFLIPERKQDFTKQHKVVEVQDLPPGSEKATLKLDDGVIVHLSDHAANIPVHSGLQATCSNGILNYEGSLPTATNLIYNTLSVPKSGTFRVILSDGTKVWLNALSEIKYPVAFSGKQRLVKISGEAYFEVAPNPAKPFLVEVNHERIEVIGTHFNVNSYRTQTRTTLLEGRVKVSNASGHKFLKPGEEAYVQGDQILVSKGDLNKVLAWRNQEFYFRNEPISEVLLELSRWYGFNVQPLPAQDHKRFSGRISRNLKLSELLNILHALSGNQFEFDGKSVRINNQDANIYLKSPK